MMKIGMGVAVIFLVLLVLRVMRTLFGRQRLHRRRLAIRTVIAAAVAALLCVLAQPSPSAWLGVAAGLVAGALLALVAYRLTAFQRPPDGVYYRPNTYVGALVVLLFLVRVGLRAATVLPLLTAAADTGAAAAPSAPTGFLGADPLTLGTIFVVNAFFIVYSATLALRARRLDAPAA